MKATKAEVRQRVDEVLKLRLGGAEFHDIVQYASDPERSWQVSERQLWNYIAAADALCKERFDAKADHLLARHLLQRRALFAHAMAAGDYLTALAVLKDEAELEALYPPKKVAPTNPEGDQEYAGGFTDAECLAILQRLYPAVGAGPGAAGADGQAAADGPLLGGPGPAAG
jgi:hypothetical protein